MHQPLKNSHENLKIFISLTAHQEKYTAYNQQREMGFGLDHYQSYTQVCKKKKRKEHDESQNLVVNNQTAILPLDPVENQPPLGSVASRMDEGMSVNQSSENSESFEYYDPGVGASAPPDDENDSACFHNDDDDKDDYDDDETPRSSVESSSKEDVDGQSLESTAYSSESRSKHHAANQDLQRSYLRRNPPTHSIFRMKLSNKFPAMASF